MLFLTFLTINFLSVDRELLDYLASKNLTSTFFVIGSRIVERPQVLVEEYMAGHEIAVHTWSHRVRVI
jgi:peptidoglycan/xylan/chitin deacetylase (PgdA/CDA1 family)